MIKTPSNTFTGFNAGVLYIGGTPSKRLVEWAEQRGLLRFPTHQHRNNCLGQGPRPPSQFDLLPEDEPTEANP